MKRNCIGFLFLIFFLAKAFEIQAQSSVTVKVDPRVELMGVLQLLTNYTLDTRHVSNYRKQVKAYFSPYKDHRVVRIFDEISKKDSKFEVLPKVFLMLSEPPDVKFRVSLPETALERMVGKEKSEEFVAALNDFVRLSRFTDFFKKHQGVYRKAAASNKTTVEKAFEEITYYSGISLQNGTVFLGLLQPEGSFAAMIESNAKRELYLILGPVGFENDLPDFGTADRISLLVAGELSHSFINVLTAKHLPEINKYSALYEPIAERMKEQAYMVWETAVNEHIARAITTRLAWRRGGGEAGEKALQEAEKNGFRYTGALAEGLKEYEADRGKYPAIADFYPRLIGIFERQARLNRVLFEPGIISTSDSEFGLTFTPEMDEVYFTRAKGRWGKEKLKSSIYFSKKTNGGWTEPQAVSFSGKYNDSDPHVTLDGKKLYFISDRPSGQTVASADIWVAERLHGGGWGEPVNLGKTINSEKNEFSPRTTAGGDLYFASDREGGFGQGDLYFSKFFNGELSEARNLGGVINSSKGEWNLEISSDGSIIIFEASGRSENFSSFGDLYISFRENDQWSIPQNIREINTTGSDLAPFISRDNKYLYYSSTDFKAGDAANLYRIDFAPMSTYRENAKFHKDK